MTSMVQPQRAIGFRLSPSLRVSRVTILGFALASHQSGASGAPATGLTRSADWHCSTRACRRSGHELLRFRVIIYGNQTCRRHLSASAQRLCQVMILGVKAPNRRPRGGSAQRNPQLTLNSCAMPSIMAQTNGGSSLACGAEVYATVMSPPRCLNRGSRPLANLSCVRARRGPISARVATADRHVKWIMSRRAISPFLVRRGP